MRKLLFFLIATAILSFPTLALADEGDLILTTSLKSVTSGVYYGALEYGWFSSVSVGLELAGYSETGVNVMISNPYVRYDFSEGSSFYANVGYWSINQTLYGSRTTEAYPSLDVGYNLDFSFLTFDLGYRTLIGYQVTSAMDVLGLGVYLKAGIRF